ncbi:hypothetical protein ACQP1U_12630 [Actinomycetota bacterium]|nr:hypothetical protein [Micrococcales bacterium]
MITLRLAVRMAYSPDPRARWRQLSVIASLFLGTLMLLTAASVTAGVARSESDLRHRSPVWAAPDESPALVVRARAIIIDGAQVPVTWLEPGERPPAAGYTTVPPGLDRLPGPGEMVLSPGLLSQGIDASSLGMLPSRAGAGGGPAIGADGLATMSEPLIYARPREGQSLGREGALLAFRGYGPQGPAEPTGWTTQPPLIGWDIAPFGVVLLLLIPALVVLGLGGRALSPTRTARAATLMRLGVATNRVRWLLALETASLAVPGAVLAFITWWFAVSRTTTVPMVGTVLKQGTFALPLIVTLPVVLVAIGLASAASGMVRSATGRRGSRSVHWWELLPLVAGVLMVVSAWVGRFSGTLLGIGTMVLFVGVLLATPLLTALLGAAMSRHRAPRLWLAGRQLTFSPRNSARPAALLGALTLLGCSSVAVYGTLLDGRLDGTSNRNASIAYVDWVGAENTTWSEVIAAAASVDAAALPVHRDSDGQTSVNLADCAPSGASACSAIRSGRPLALLESSGIQTSERAGPVDTEAAVIIKDKPLADSTLYQALAPIAPALNIRELTPSTLAAPLYFKWLLVAWLVTTAALSLAVLREVGDRVMRLTWTDRYTMIRAGLRPVEIISISRASTLVPLASGAVLGFLAGCLVAFSGRTNRITVVDLPALTAYLLVAVLTSAATALFVLRLLRDRTP